jgi:hypothetical protein
VLSTKERLERNRTEKRHGRRSASTTYGFEVGRDIKLPRLPRKYDKKPEKETRGELAFGHIVSGHMKMQPHGPRNSLRKLIFVAPYIVRPDCPLKPKATPHMVEPKAS